MKCSFMHVGNDSLQQKVQIVIRGLCQVVVDLKRFVYDVRYYNMELSRTFVEKNCVEPNCDISVNLCDQNCGKKAVLNYMY